MASTKKESTGTQAGAGARMGVTKAKDVAQQAETKTTASSKQATPLKLTDRQRAFLQKIQDAGEAGYEVGPKAEQRTIDALAERKLIKRGSKNKETGKQRYLLTKAAEKHLTPAPPTSTAGPKPASPTA